MYYLASTNQYYDGQQFSSLVDAIQSQDSATASGFICDVMRETATHKVVVKASPLAPTIANRIILKRGFSKLV